MSDKWCLVTRVNVLGPRTYILKDAEYRKEMRSKGEYAAGPICEIIEQEHAPLITTAPDLYEALKLLHDNLLEYNRINKLGGENNHDMRLARTALAKAKGL